MLNHYLNLYFRRQHGARDSLMLRIASRLVNRVILPRLTAYGLCMGACLWSTLAFSESAAVSLSDNVVSAHLITPWLVPFCVVALVLIALLSLLASLFDRDTINSYFSLLCWIYLSLWGIQNLSLLNASETTQLFINSLLICAHSVILLLLTRRFMSHSDNPSTLPVNYSLGLLALSLIIVMSAVVSGTLDLAYLAALLAHSIIIIQCFRQLVSQPITRVLTIVGLICSLIPLVIMYINKGSFSFWWQPAGVLPLLFGGVLQALFFCLVILHKLALKKQQYQASIEQLKQRVDDSDDDLREINQQQKILISQLEAANQTKAMFLANMSHEVRTPLTTIVGFSQSLKMDMLEPQKRIQACDVIHKHSQHLLTLIDDILQLSVLESKPFDVTYKDCFILPFFTVIGDNFRQLAEQKGLQCKIDYGFPIPSMVSMDSSKLRQILTYLMSNAIKFTASGSVGLTITFKDNNLKVTVSDTGIGIDDDKFDDIFDPFNQADNSSERAFGGTGVGLTICRSLVDALAGDISVSSDGHSASQFCLTLPCAVSEQAEWIACAEQMSIVNMANRQAETIVTSLHGDVLLAEDQHDSRQLITLILEKMGFNVHAVSDGQGAIDACQLMAFDIILLDIQMPNVDGLEAFRRIRAQGNSTPVIAITANVMPHEIDKYAALGFSDYIAKPIDFSLFSAALTPYSVGDHGSEIIFSEQEMRPLRCAFLQGAGEDLEQLNLAWGNRDIQHMLTISHKIKGSAATFKFNILSSLAAQLDSQLKDKAHESDLRASVEAIISHYNTLKADWL